jgi:hypothetical protein
MKDAGQEIGIPCTNLPMLTHVPESADKKVDRGVDPVIDSRAMDEENPCRNPEREGEGWTKLGQQSIFSYASAKSSNTLNCIQASLTCTKGRCEDG